jgi:hypothetical protein
MGTKCNSGCHQTKALSNEIAHCSSASSQFTLQPQTRRTAPPGWAAGPLSLPQPVAPNHTCQQLAASCGAPACSSPAQQRTSAKEIQQQHRTAQGLHQLCTYPVYPTGAAASLCWQPKHHCKIIACCPQMLAASEPGEGLPASASRDARTPAATVPQGMLGHLLQQCLRGCYDTCCNRNKSAHAAGRANGKAGQRTN